MVIDGFRLGNAVVARIKEKGVDEDMVFSMCKIGDETRKRFYQQCSINERDARMLCWMLDLNVLSFMVNEYHETASPGLHLDHMGYDLVQDDEVATVWRKRLDPIHADGTYHLKIDIFSDPKGFSWSVLLSDSDDKKGMSPIVNEDFPKALQVLKLVDAAFRVKDY